MIRIVSGSAGGRRLGTPTGSGTRPTSDRVREALFSRLDHLDVLSGARVLDLYAGSGALAFEAMSRGAAHALLVESDRGAGAVARRNAQVDLVFLDPPYDLPDDRLGDVLALLVGHRWLAPDALVVVERSSRGPQPAWPVGLAEAGERRYGETKVWFADAPGPDEVA